LSHNNHAIIDKLRPIFNSAIGIKKNPYLNIIPFIIIALLFKIHIVTIF